MSSKLLEGVLVIILVRNRWFLLHVKILAHSLSLMLQSPYVTALDSCSFKNKFIVSLPKLSPVHKALLLKWILFLSGTCMKAWVVICNRPAIDSRKERNSFKHSTDTNHKKIGCPVAHIHVPLTLCYKGAGCVGLTGHSFLLH